MSEEREMHHLAKAISELASALNAGNDQRRIEFEWHKSHPNLATKLDLDRMEIRIMSAISDFASKQNSFNDRIDSAVTGLQGDVAALNAKITELQNSPGTVTPEDQALLDALQSRGETIAAKLEALDALTPPTPPVTP